jgi:hypothetical protein
LIAEEVGGRASEVKDGAIGERDERERGKWGGFDVA